MQKDKSSSKVKTEVFTTSELEEVKEASKKREIKTEVFTASELEEIQKASKKE